MHTRVRMFIYTITLKENDVGEFSHLSLEIPFNFNLVIEVLANHHSVSRATVSLKIEETPSVYHGTYYI